MSREAEPEKTDRPDAQVPCDRGDVADAAAMPRQLTAAALMKFLGDQRSDWLALSRELRALAESSPSAGGGDAGGDRELRQNWELLADYLAHSDRSTGKIPWEVRQFLKSDAGARAAEAAFSEAVATHHQAWLDLAKKIRRRTAD